VGDNGRDAGETCEKNAGTTASDGERDGYVSLRYIFGQNSRASAS